MTSWILRRRFSSLKLFGVVLTTLYLSTHAYLSLKLERHPTFSGRRLLHQFANKSSRKTHDQWSIVRSDISGDDVIHLACISHNSDSIFKMITFLKSVLFYRTRSIHLHVMTNEDNFLTIRTFFSGWNLPRFTVSLYVRPDTEPKTDWIPFVHAPGKFAFKKLLLDDILPNYVNKVILYDTDVVMQSDISQLWDIFDKFNRTQAIGMSYDTQHWYGVYKEAWPALEWGFNTGLMLCDLEKLRKMNWSKLWYEDAKKELEVRKCTWLAEQDLLNVYVLKNPEILYRLPCTWNMQFGDRVNLKSCPQRVYKALHTTHSKLKGTPVAEVPNLRIYHEALSMFEKMNGTQFSVISPGVYRTLPFAFGFDFARDSGKLDVTLTLGIGFKDLSAFRLVTESWDGFISVALLVTDEEAANSSSLPYRPNIVYHFVYKNKADDEVPQNYLEDVALEYVQSTHVLATDVSSRMHGKVCDNLRDMLERNVSHATLMSVNPKRKLNEKTSLEDVRTISQVDNSSRLYHTMMPVEDYRRLIAGEGIRIWTKRDSLFSIVALFQRITDPSLNHPSGDSDCLVHTE